MKIDIIVNDFLPQKDIIFVKEKFKKHSIRIYKASDNNIKVNADVLVSLGGDGTVLKSTELVYGTNISIFAINRGKVGALTEFEFNKFSEKSLYNKIIQKKLLTAKIKKENTWCLNEFVINRDIMQGKAILISVSVELNNGNKQKIIKKMTGDGIIVSTKSGSTAYNKAAGGIVLKKDAIAIAPIASNNLTPFVIPIESKITIIPLLLNSIFVADSRRFINLTKNEKIVITNNSRTVNFISGK